MPVLQKIYGTIILITGTPHSLSSTFFEVQREIEILAIGDNKFRRKVTSEMTISSYLLLHIMIVSLETEEVCSEYYLESKKNVN